MKMRDGNKTWLAATVAAFFVVLALVGGFVTARHMNTTATIHGSSAGRSGEPTPNGIQEQQADKPARGPSTTGTKTQGAVPPASR